MNLISGKLVVTRCANTFPEDSTKRKNMSPIADEEQTQAKQYSHGHCSLIAKLYHIMLNTGSLNSLRPNKVCNRIILLLTLSTPAVPNCCRSKGSAPYWSNPPFLISDIRALWRSVLSARAPECQKLKMVG